MWHGLFLLFEVHFYQNPQQTIVDNYDHIWQHGLDASVSQLGLAAPKNDIFKARESTLLVEVFQTFCDKNISGSPIVDNEDRVIGALSITDFQFSDAFNNYDQYSKRTVQDFIVDNPIKRTRPITCSGDTSLIAVLQKMVVAEVHRIFLVDDDDHVVAIISGTDVLKAILKTAGF